MNPPKSTRYKTAIKFKRFYKVTKKVLLSKVLLVHFRLFAIAKTTDCEPKYSSGFSPQFCLYFIANGFF